MENSSVNTSSSQIDLGFAKGPAHASEWWPLFTGILVTSYLAWRLWKFNLRPLVYPKDPPIYPYLIPGLGHAIPFFQNSYQVFDDAVKHFGQSRPVYSLVIAGKSIYVVTNTDETQELYKNAKSLSWESFVKDLFIWLGYSPASVDTLWKPPAPEEQAADPARDRAPVHMMEKYQRTQCLPGEKSRSMASKLLQHIQDSTSWQRLREAPFVSSHSQNNIEVDLYAWTSHCFIRALSEVYWGPEIFEINPDLISDYAQWEKLTWKYIFQLPRSISEDMYSARDKLITTFETYFELDNSKRPQTNWWVPMAETEFRQIGLNSLDVARAHMLSHWAVNGNMHKVSFWMLTEILHDPGLRHEIQKEVQAAYVDGHLDFGVFEKSCPQLDAVWHEVLRMRMTTSLARKVTQDTQIGNKILKSGTEVVVPYKVLHHDASVFGAHPESFDKTRFLNRPKLASHTSYKPFGGGAHLCPGRFIAKQLVYSFITIALSMQPTINKDKGCGGQRPRPRWDKPALGSLAPVPGDRVFIILHNAGQRV